MHLNSSCFETQVSDKTKFSALSVFLKLFSHRYSSITKSDKWTTVKHVLTDGLLTSLWKSAREIVGVRFGSKTQYCLLDIDIGSIYHPNNSDRLPELLGCLEEVGFTRYILIQSSRSEGLHIYFVFSEQLSTFKVASLLASTLKDAGFPLMKGELEIFPNTKTFVATNDSSKFTKYNGHRLPLQEGSFVLDENYEPYSNSLEYFISCCKWCAEGIDIDEIKENLFKPKKISNKNNVKTESAIEKWKEDIGRVIKTGWTDYHQTNQIIYKLAQKVIVFDETIYEEKLSWMVSTIKEMPGYKEYCRHQHEIIKRCQDWLICLLKKGYHWSYGTGLSRDPSLTFEKATESVNIRNLEQEELVTFRLIETLHHLSGQLFNSVNSLFKAIHAKGKSLFDKGFSNRTLYKYQHLWSPMMEKHEEKEVMVDIPELESNSYQETSNVEEAETLTEKLLPTPPPNYESKCFSKVLGKSQDLNAALEPKDLKILKTKNQKINYINKFIQEFFKSGIKTKIDLQISRLLCKFLLQNLESFLTKPVGQLLDVKNDALGKDTIGREEISSQVIDAQQSIVLDICNSYLDDDGCPVFVGGGVDDDVNGDCPGNYSVNNNVCEDVNDDVDDEIIVGEVAVTRINIDSDIATVLVNNDHLRSDVIDDNSSDSINFDDSRLDNVVSNLDIVPADISIFDDSVSSISNLDDHVVDSSDPNAIDDCVIDTSVIDSTERSNVFSESEDVCNSDCNDVIDDDSLSRSRYHIINSTYRNVNTTKFHRKNYHPFHHVCPIMTIQQIKSMYPKSKWLEVFEHFGYSTDDLLD